MNALQGLQGSQSLQALQQRLQRQPGPMQRSTQKLVVCQHHCNRSIRPSLLRAGQSHAQKRATRLTQYCSAGSGTWPSQPSESLEPVESQEAIEQIPKVDLEAPKTSFDSTDEAATRVGLSSKGSKRLAGFWGAYSKALEEHPIRVKSATSFFGFLLGDAVAQLIVGNPYNYLRTLRMVIFGVLMDGPIGESVKPDVLAA